MLIILWFIAAALVALGVFAWAIWRTVEIDRTKSLALEIQDRAIRSYRADNESLKKSDAYLRERVRELEQNLKTAAKLFR